MESILLFIKHHLTFIWNIIDFVNGIIFSILYKSKLNNVFPEVCSNLKNQEFKYKQLDLNDIQSLFNLIEAQPSEDLRYFRPHQFDLNSLKLQNRKPAFFMMGAFDDQKLIGYFFLRFFANKKCFVGRLIDKDYRGRGIGVVMNYMMYEISWRMGFRCLSTISTNNKAVIGAHAKNQAMIVLKKLKNDYILVEFVKKTSDSDNVEKNF